jgi:hypothetical protein
VKIYLIICKTNLDKNIALEAQPAGVALKSRLIMLHCSQLQHLSLSLNDFIVESDGTTRGSKVLLEVNEPLVSRRCSSKRGVVLSIAITNRFILSRWFVRVAKFISAHTNL